MSRCLFSMPRPAEFKSGKPVFPTISWDSSSSCAPKLSSFITSDSWLLFDLLGLEGPQEWLQTPPNMWELFVEFRKLRDFATNVSVVNDLAERGMHMITEFASVC